MDIKTFENVVTDIIFKSNSSINHYMFFGGTNFGFMAGGDENTAMVTAMVTSYDYNAPLSESGLWSCGLILIIINFINRQLYR